MIFVITDNYANAAVVQGTRKMPMIEWRLQDTSGKHNLVLISAVISVHYCRSRVPESLIHWLSKTGNKSN